MKNKKKWIIISITVILLFPIRSVLNDGGSVKYKSLIYEIINYHQINNNYSSGYKTGLEMKILGLTIYKNLLPPNNFSKIIKIENHLYYEVKEEELNYNQCSSNSYDGIINSHIKLGETPQNNNESNFEDDYKYYKVSRNVIKICQEDKTLYFKRRTETNENTVDGSLDIESDFVTNLYYKVNPSNDISILKEIYGSNTLANDYILTTGIENLVRKNHLRLSEFINANDVENEIHKIFGSNVTISHHDIYTYSSDEYGKTTCGYTYLPNSKQYQLIHGCGGNSYESMKRKLISAEKQGNTILLKEKSIFVYDDWNDLISKIFIYNNYNREKLLDYIEKSSKEELNILLENYIEEASTYIYVFEKENEDWIFKKIVRE